MCSLHQFIKFILCSVMKHHRWVLLEEKLASFQNVCYEALFTAASIDFTIRRYFHRKRGMLVSAMMYLHHTVNHETKKPVRSTVKYLTVCTRLAFLSMISAPNVLIPEEKCQTTVRTVQYVQRKSISPMSLTQTALPAPRSPQIHALVYRRNRCYW